MGIGKASASTSRVHDLIFDVGQGAVQLETEESIQHELLVFAPMHPRSLGQMRVHRWSACICRKASIEFVVNLSPFGADESRKVANTCLGNLEQTPAFTKRGRR